MAADRVLAADESSIPLPPTLWRPLAPSLEEEWEGGGHSIAAPRVILWPSGRSIAEASRRSDRARLNDSS